MTAVQEATHVSLILAEENNAYTAIEELVCGFDSNGSAVCTESLYAAAAGGTITTTAVASGSAYVLALPVQASTATSATTPILASGTASDNLARATATSPASNQTSVSGASRLSSFGLFSAILASLSWVLMLSL